MKATNFERIEHEIELAAMTYCDSKKQWRKGYAKGLIVALEGIKKAIAKDIAAYTEASSAEISS